MFFITRCWSYIGNVQTSGGQPISIGAGCGIIGTVLHEIMHAVGFFHTSSRYDRDSYVVIIPENITPGNYGQCHTWYRWLVLAWYCNDTVTKNAAHHKVTNIWCIRIVTPLIQLPQVLTFVMCCSVGLEHNFQKYTHAQLDRLEAPYDMGSVMHLPGKAFSKNGLNTIEARAGAYIPLGGSDDLSEIDKAQLNLLYGCTGYPSKYICANFNSKCYTQTVSPWHVWKKTQHQYDVTKGN